MTKFITKVNSEYGCIEVTLDNIIIGNDGNKYLRFDTDTGDVSIVNGTVDNQPVKASDTIIQTEIPITWFRLQQKEQVVVTYSTPSEPNGKKNCLVFAAYPASGIQRIAIYDAQDQLTPPVPTTGKILHIDIPLNANRPNFQVLRTIPELGTTTQQVGLLSSTTDYNYKDNLIIQGETTPHYLVQYSSEPPITAVNQNIIVDFEDIFLSDISQSLRLRFNPKVSSLKTVFQEQKIETIGGKYPFFVRNGNLKYKEIPISGLLSSEMDEFFDFGMNSHNSQFRQQTPETSLESYSLASTIAKERQFKMAVEAWLTNGQPKIFRSPTEGNYIIRLTNVALQPMEQLGRRLHSFSATAYEIADYTWDNIKRLGFNQYL